MADTKEKKPKKPEIKYQAQIHKAFAETIDKEAKEKFDKLVESNPELKDVVVFNHSKESAAISDSNIEICKFFFLNEDSAFDFSGKPHLKSVAQTVRANITAYNNFVTFEDEEEQADYKKIYKALIKKLDDYFALAAESALRQYYGDDYISFAEQLTEEKEKQQAARLATRKANSGK